MLLAVAIAFAVAAVIFAAVAWRLRERVRDLTGRLTWAAPLAIRGGLPPAQAGPLVNPPQWRLVARGGNTNAGITGNIGFCPCQREYTVATRQVAVNAWPNAAVLNACTANPPPPDPAGLPCTPQCQPVMTHVWHGWSVYRNAANGQMVFNCMTFAQYHCKLPTDPDFNKPPRLTDPNDPNPEL